MWKSRHPGLCPGQLYILHKRRRGRILPRPHTHWRKRRVRPADPPENWEEDWTPEPIQEEEEEQISETSFILVETSEPRGLMLTRTQVPDIIPDLPNALWRVSLTREKGLLIIEPAGALAERKEETRSLWRIAKVMETGVVLIEEKTQLPVLVTKGGQGLWLVKPLPDWKPEEKEERPEDNQRESIPTVALSMGEHAATSFRLDGDIRENKEEEQGEQPVLELRVIDGNRSLWDANAASLPWEEKTEEVEEEKTEETQEKEAEEEKPEEPEEEKEESEEGAEEDEDEEEEDEEEETPKYEGPAFEKKPEPDLVPPPPPTMTEEELMASIEAILFSMGDSVEITSLMKALGRTRQEIEAAIDKLIWRYKEDGDGITILHFEDAVQMATTADQYSNIIRLVDVPKKQPLSDAMIETLSIIAWQQPVTRSQIEAVRGVDCAYSINKLLEQDFIREVGRKEAPGRPILFGTTENFLRFFGISSIDDLPQMQPGLVEELKSEAEKEVDERLNSK